MRKIVTLTMGFIFLAIGAVGVVLPVLPTTPFLLLASFCLAKGSTRFHQWLVSTKLYRNHINQFVAEKAMPLKTKLCILLPASLMLILAFIFCPVWQARLFLFFAMIYKYYYFFFKIKTIKTKVGRNEKVYTG